METSFAGQNYYLEFANEIKNLHLRMWMVFYLMDEQGFCCLYDTWPLCIGEYYIFILQSIIWEVNWKNIYRNRNKPSTGEFAFCASHWSSSIVWHNAGWFWGLRIQAGLEGGRTSMPVRSLPAGGRSWLIYSEKTGRLGRFKLGKGTMGRRESSSVAAWT